MKLIQLNCIVFFLFLGIVSCDRPNCNNQNAVFETNLPESKTYKDELVKQLANVDQSKLSYWFQKYEQQNGSEFLHFYVQGDDLCATLVLTMKNWHKLEHVRDKKGNSYHGAQFTNLKFYIQQDSLSTTFVYQTFEKVID